MNFMQQVCHPDDYGIYQTITLLMHCLPQYSFLFATQ
jgi:hypothetical protein